MLKKRYAHFTLFGRDTQLITSVRKSKQCVLTENKVVLLLKALYKICSVEHHLDSFVKLSDAVNALKLYKCPPCLWRGTCSYS